MLKAYLVAFLKVFGPATVFVLMTGFLTDGSFLVTPLAIVVVFVLCGIGLAWAWRD